MEPAIVLVDVPIREVRIVEKKIKCILIGGNLTNAHHLAKSLRLLSLADGKSITVVFNSLSVRSFLESAGVIVVDENGAAHTGASYHDFCKELHIALYGKYYEGGE